jgi:hypothetical protein
MFNSEKFLEDCMVLNTNTPRESYGSKIQRDGVDLANRFLGTALIEYIQKLKDAKIAIKLDGDVTEVKSNFIVKQKTDIYIGSEPGLIEFRDNSVRVTDSNGNVIIAYLNGRPKSTTDSFEGSINILSYLLDKTQGNESVTAALVSTPIVIEKGEGKIAGKGKKDLLFYNKKSLDTAKFSMEYPTCPPSIDTFRKYMSDRYVEPDKNEGSEPEYENNNAFVSKDERTLLKVLFQNFGQEVKTFSETPEETVKL